MGKILSKGTEKILFILALIGWLLAALFYWRMEWTPKAYEDVYRLAGILRTELNEKDDYIDAQQKELILIQSRLIHAKADLENCSNRNY